MADFRPVYIGIALATTALFSCAEVDKESVSEDMAPVSKFSLNADVYRFSESLGKGDTLELAADLSLGTSWHTERNIFYKKGNQTMIESSQEGEFVSEDEENLSPVKYPSSGNDTLTFEHLLKYLSEHSPTKGKGSIFLVVHGRDTMRYGGTGLMESMRTVNYYREIKKSLYPKSELYREVIVPTEE